LRRLAQSNFARACRAERGKSIKYIWMSGTYGKRKLNEEKEIK
jgi:hypothetical protein